MVVSAGQGLRCYPAAAPCERVLKDRRHGPVEKAIALLLPHSVKRAVAWCVKEAVRTAEAILELTPNLTGTTGASGVERAAKGERNGGS